MKKVNFLLIFLLFGLFASIFSLQKISLKYSDPLFLIGFRMFFSGIVIILIYGLKNIKIKSRDYIYFLILSLFNIFLTNCFEIYGLKNMSSSKACLIYSSSPFLTAFFSFIFLNEKLNLKKTIGMIIGFIGLIPLIFFKSKDEIEIKNLLYFSISELYLFIAVIFSILGWIFLKKILNLGYSFLIANGISMLIGGIFILLSSYFLENWNPLPIKNVKNFFIYTLLTCIISNIICYNLFGYLLKHFSTTFMTFSGLMTPFFATFFGWYLLDEEISINFFISIFIFFIGLLIYFNEEKKES